MTTERKLAEIFHLTDENWLRHANPWSVGKSWYFGPDGLAL